MSSRRAALTVVFGLLLLPGTARAAPAWVAPFNFPVPASDTSVGGLQGQDQILYQNGGIATEAFVQVVSYPTPLQTVLHIGTMAPGGSYADQLTIASSEEAIPLGIQIAVAPNGAAVATWTELAGSNLEKSPERFRAAYRPAGSATWEAPFTLATETERERLLPDSDPGDQRERDGCRGDTALRQRRVHGNTRTPQLPCRRRRASGWRVVACPRTAEPRGDLGDEPRACGRRVGRSDGCLHEALLRRDQRK